MSEWIALYYKTCCLSNCLIKAFTWKWWVKCRVSILLCCTWCDMWFTLKKVVILVHLRCYKLFVHGIHRLLCQFPPYLWFHIPLWNHSLNVFAKPLRSPYLSSVHYHYLYSHFPYLLLHLRKSIPVKWL